MASTAAGRLRHTMMGSTVPGAPADAARGALTRRQAIVLLAALAALVAVTRIPLAPAHLFSFDNVNLALALEKFDPRLHQPQPPGYPMFVAEARLMNLFFGNAETSFLACALLAAVAAPFTLYLLGSRMYSAWVGGAAALLLVLNPVFWRCTLTSPLRPYLAVISTLTAYFCHRAAAGQTGFIYLSALALGLGAGWRPVLGVLLFPLWLLCAWRGARHPRQIGAGLLVIAASVLIWLAPLAVVTGGPAELMAVLARYAGEQTAGSSPLAGSAFWGWWRMATQGFVWLALAVVGWFWVLPLALKVSQASKVPANQPPIEPPLQPPIRRISNGLFLAAWVGPSLAFLALVHVASPGHVLGVVPALCLLGGEVLDRGARGAAHFLPRAGQPRWAFLAAALAINLAFFVYPFRIPNPRPHIRGTLAQAREQFRFWGASALRRTSYAHVRARSGRIADRLQTLSALGHGSPDGKQLIIVWQDDDVSWRKITYYFPSHPTWVLEGLSGPNRVPHPGPRLWRDKQIIAAEPGESPGPLPVPAGGRVAWLLHLHSDLPDQLRAQGVPLTRFGALFLTDLRAAPQEFRAGPFLFRQQ